MDEQYVAVRIGILYSDAVKVKGDAFALQRIFVVGVFKGVGNGFNDGGLGQSRQR